MELNFHNLRREPTSAQAVREVTERDIANLDAVKGVGTPTIARLRDSHHAIARLVALGRSDVETAAITGYSANRVCVLKKDPSFQELVAFYKDRVAEEFIDFTGRLKSVSLDALNVLHERIVETPESMENRELSEIVKMGADRTGFGPPTKNGPAVSVSFSLSALVKQSVELEESRKVIDVTPD